MNDIDDTLCCSNFRIGDSKCKYRLEVSGFSGSSGVGKMFIL